MLEINAAVKAQVAYQSDSDAIPVARVNGITTRRRGAVRRIGRRPGRGDESRWLDVGGSHAQARGRRQLPVPAARSRRWRRRWRRQRRRQPQVRGSEEGARCARAARRGSDRARARLRAAFRRPNAPRTGTSPRWCRWPTASSRCSSPRTATADIREAVAFARSRRRQDRDHGRSRSRRWWRRCSRTKNIPVVLGSVLTLPAREDAHHAATYRAAGELAQAGVLFAFGTGGAGEQPVASVRSGDLGGVGPRSRSRAARDDARRRDHSRRRRSRRLARSPARSRTSFIANGDPMEMKTQFTHIFINGKNVGLEEQAHRAQRTLLIRPGVK